jgi:hypothetical protein
VMVLTVLVVMMGCVNGIMIMVMIMLVIIVVTGNDSMHAW